LLRPEVDHALQARREQLLGAVVGEPDDLLDTGDTHAREREVDGRQAGLDVGDGGAGAHTPYHGSDGTPCGRRGHPAITRHPRTRGRKGFKVLVGKVETAPQRTDHWSGPPAGNPARRTDVRRETESK